MTVHRHDLTTVSAPNRLRPLLREWRAFRNLSQLALALEVGVSQRHLSFVESGRAAPSRELVLRIAQALDIPLRARNDLLTAAGFAPAFAERSLAASDMRTVRSALERILQHHEPFPAMVLDGAWNIVMRNATNARLVDTLADTTALKQRSPDGELNFVRLMLADDGLRPHIRNWQVAITGLMTRVKREARANPGSPSELLLSEMASLIPDIGAAPDTGEHLPPTVPLELEVDGTVLRLVNMLTTFGTPQDVSVQELRVEMSFPADDSTEAFLTKAWQGGVI